MIGGDRAWFAAHRHRNHRVRLATQAEAALLPPVPPGTVWMLAVWQYRKGLVRHYAFTAPEPGRTWAEPDEEAASWAFYAMHRKAKRMVAT